MFTLQVARDTERTLVDENLEPKHVTQTRRILPQRRSGISNMIQSTNADDSPTTHRRLLKHLNRHLGQEPRHALSLDDPEMSRIFQSTRQRSSHLHRPEMTFLTREFERQAHLPFRRVHRREADIRSRLVELDPPA